MLSLRPPDVMLCGTLWAASLLTAAAQANVAHGGEPGGPAYLIVRRDDAGMSHSVNPALERLNSEWKGLRWGPVAGMTAVLSLVGADGFFFPTAAALYRNHTRNVTLVSTGS